MGAVLVLCGVSTRALAPEHITWSNRRWQQQYRNYPDQAPPASSQAADMQGAATLAPPPEPRVRTPAETRAVTTEKAARAGKKAQIKVRQAERAKAKTRGLLTREEERRLANQVVTLRAWHAAHEALAAELGREPELAEWADALGLAGGDAELDDALAQLHDARDTLVLRNMRLVMSMARKTYYGSGGKVSSFYGAPSCVDRDGGALTYDELVAEGTIGLIRAVDKFEPERGFRFSTYATWWVRQALQLAVKRRFLIKIPVYAQQLNARAELAAFTLAEELDRAPTEAEIAARANLKTVEKLRTVRATFRTAQTLSLDLPLQFRSGSSGDTAATMKDLVKSPVASPESAALYEELREALGRSMNAVLTAPERDVLRMRLGVDGGPAMTRNEVCDRFQLSKYQMAKLEKDALSKLRETADPLLLEYETML